MKKKGFTIVELVIVIAIIAILAAVLIPTFSTVIKNANRSAAQSKAKNALEVVSMEVTLDGNTLDHAYIIAGDYYFTYDASASPALSKGDDYKADTTTLSGVTFASTDVAYAKVSEAKTVFKTGSLAATQVKANADIAEDVIVIVK